MIHHAAKVLVFRPDGRLLVLRRSHTHPRWPLHYDMPGGNCERGESPTLTARRETLEELGVDLGVHNLRRVKTFRTPLGSSYHLYHVKLTEPVEVTISWEHDLHEWVEVDELLRRPLPHRAEPFYISTLKYLEKAYGSGVNNSQ